MTNKKVTAQDAEKAADLTKKLTEEEQVKSDDILEETAGGALAREAWKVSYET